MTSTFSAMSRTLFLLFILLAVAAKDAAADDGSETVVRRAGDTIFFDGPISDSAAARLELMLRQPTAWLVIRSPGGDAMAGQTIAKSLLEHPIDVRVQQYCLSACANYVYLFGRRKFLDDGAVVGFHGGVGLPSDDRNANGNPNGTRMRELADREASLFRAIGVDHALLEKSYRLTKPATKTITYRIQLKDGTVLNYPADAEQQAQQALAGAMSKNTLASADITFNNASDTLFYFPSRKSLEAAGVHGIETYEYPANARQLRDYARVLDGLELIGDFGG